MKVSKYVAILYVIINGTILTFSQNTEIKDDSLKSGGEIPVFSLIGENRDGLISHLPGAATHIDAEELRRLSPLTGNEALRRVAGINVIDEEGAGMRMNVGIRGTDPDRSRSILILEDGIPVSINPYGENELYYTPIIDRMEGIEVLKGSGQILYGPQTIGGIINYITAPPPDKLSVKVKFMGGRGTFMNGLVSVGTTYKKSGFSLTYLRKQAENLGATWFRINDISGKWTLQLSPKSSISTKVGYYDENSNATYVGLTQRMYESGDLDFVQIAPYDRLYVQRISGSIHHEHKFNKQYAFAQTIFGYTTTRLWQRQDFTYSPSPAAIQVWGDTTISGGALYMLNSNAHQDRRFLVAGYEARFSAKHQIASKMSNQLDAGARFMYEKADEELIKGSKADAPSGSLQNKELRRGYAVSLFLQDKFYFHPNLHITAGVRGEFYWFEREILRRNNIDTHYTNSNFIAQIIPGIGLGYNLINKAQFFAGVHRGFAPPRVKDAISGSGEVYNLEAEQSWNTELGMRINHNNWFHAEVTGFFTDFSNQIIPVSQSSGGVGSGYVNGGATRHLGVEIAVRFDIAPIIKLKNYMLAFDASFTYCDARFRTDRFLVQGADTVNVYGNRLPYAPPITLSAAFTFETPFGLGARFNGYYSAFQYTDPINSETASVNGRSGKMNDYFLLDGSVYYKVPKIFTTFRLSVKNMSNERYIASRRPQGIRVGLPWFIAGGFEFSF